MKDHVWEHNNRFRLEKVAGQQDQYDLFPVPGTVYEVGTPIRKVSMLQDATYNKYKDAAKSGTMPSTGDGTQNDVFNALTNAYANGISIIMGQSLKVGAAGKETEGFAKWDSILYDATGKCKLDTSFNNTNYCTKLYIPKGIKRVKISAGFTKSRTTQYAASVAAKIYKNGSELQSMYLGNSTPAAENAERFVSSENVITTTGSGTEYIQLLLKGAYESGTFPKATTIQCFWLEMKMLSF